MTDHEHGDGDDDDLSLGSMRSLFRDLRDADEEPPARGMAELLAAARQQAEHNKVKHEEAVAEASPSLWRKFLAMFARPPVLAFATIALLVGGGIIVTRHKDDVGDTAKAPSVALDRERAQDTAARPAKNELELKKDDGAERLEDHAPPKAPEKMGEAQTTSTGQGSGQAAQGHAGPGNVENRWGGNGKADAVAPPKPAPVATPSLDATTPKPASVEPPASQSDVPEKPTEPPPPPPPAQGETAVSNDRVDPNVSAPQTQAPHVDQQKPTSTATKPSSSDLLAKSHEAATKGDCTTSRAIANKIASQDNAFYRKSVATDPAIAKCIQSSQIAH